MLLFRAIRGDGRRITLATGYLFPDTDGFGNPGRMGIRFMVFRNW